jgi:hypothetical protein
MKRIFATAGLLAVTASMALVTATHADAKKLSAETFTFDPDHTHTVVAKWVTNLGLPDAKGNRDKGLLLSKQIPQGQTSSNTNSAAGVTIKGVKGMHLTEVGFDLRNGSHCGAGAPRFNVLTTDNVFHFVGGCANAGSKLADTPQQGWTRVRIDPSVNNVQAFPAVTPTEIVKSIELIVDEGTDTGPDNSGMYVLDNIDINGVLISRGHN